MKDFFTVTVLIFCMIQNLTAQNEIPFFWAEYIDNKGIEIEKSAMMIPVELSGNDKYAMQLDLGAPKSILYRNLLEDAVFYDSIKDSNSYNDSLFGYQLKLENQNVIQNEFEVITYSNSKEAEGIQKAKGVIEDYKNIGTLGRSFLVEDFIYIDYAKEYILRPSIESYLSLIEDMKYKVPIKVEYGFVVVPITFNGKRSYVMFDTGSSTSTINLNGRKGLRLVDRKSISDSFDVKSWRDKITYYETKGSNVVKIGKLKMEVETIQFIPEQYRFYKTFNDINLYFKLMKFRIFRSVIGVMGNRLFLDKKILIDYKNEMLYISE